MNEFDLGAFWQNLVRGWKTPVTMAVVAAALGVVSLIGAIPVYSVHMLIIPAASDQASVAVPGAITSLLGVAGGTGQSANYVRYQNLLFSNAVAQRMQDKYGMLQYAFKGSWDAKNHEWIESQTLMSELKSPLLRLANVPVWSPPDITTLAQFLKASIVVLPSATNDIIDVSMNSKDVAYATHIMLVANEEANAVLRDQVARRASQQVEYLRRKLAQTTVEDYRQTLLALLSSEEKTLMLTQTDASFAAEIISPPMASPTPVAPRPVLTVFVTTLVGAIMGSGLVVFFGPDWWQKLGAWMPSLLRKRIAGKPKAARV